MVRFIVPVKAPARGKSRLDVPDRAALVTAMLLDTLVALRTADAGPIVVVSPDTTIRELVERMGCGFMVSDAGLNAAIALAVGPGRNAAVLPDLPALRPGDVQDLAGHGRGYVPDAAGTGTTMAIDLKLRPVFGKRSAQSFAAQGLPILAAAATARRDVDTRTDLIAAAALGVGTHTSAWLEKQKAGPVWGPAN